LFSVKFPPEMYKFRELSMEWEKEVEGCIRHERKSRDGKVGELKLMVLNIRPRKLKERVTRGSAT